MALETPTKISQLVGTNPAAGDPVSEGDDHIRNIKKVLKTSFPNDLDVHVPLITDNADKFLKVNSDATAIEWVPSEEVTVTGLGYIRYRMATTMTIADRTPRIFELSDQRDDFSIAESGSTSYWDHSRYTVPAPGIYHVDFCTRLNGYTSGIVDHDIRIRRNDLDWKVLSYTQVPYDTPTPHYSLQIQGAVHCPEAGDTISVWGSTESQVTFQAGLNTQITIYRIA